MFHRAAIRWIVGVFRRPERPLSVRRSAEMSLWHSFTVSLKGSNFGTCHGQMRLQRSLASAKQGCLHSYHCTGAIAAKYQPKWLAKQKHFRSRSRQEKTEENSPYARREGGWLDAKIAGIRSRHIVRAQLKREKSIKGELWPQNMTSALRPDRPGVSCVIYGQVCRVLSSWLSSLSF